MPADGFKVNGDELDKHAGSLDKVAADIGTAKAAGETVRLGTYAYGQMCMVIPITINVLQGILTDGIEDAIQSVRHNSEQLHDLAKQYREADEKQQQAFEQLHNKLKGAHSRPRHR